MRYLFYIIFCIFYVHCSSDTEVIQSQEEADIITDIENTSEDENNNTVNLYFPPANTDNWEIITPESLGWNEDALIDLNQFLSETATSSFIILKNGRIVVESYFNGTQPTDFNPWFSAGKTLTAFTLGIAQKDGFISIDDPSSQFLGNGWTAMPPEQEIAIRLRHQLTMTSGGDYTLLNLNCTASECLGYLNDAGDFWFYHNAFYTLLQPVLNAAIPQGFDSYFYDTLKDPIGMDGFWFQNGFNRFYLSDARSMARFGLLNLNRGNWNGQQLINTSFFEAMTTTSQNNNLSYGYLWWLNGKESFRLPGSTQLFDGSLISNAPSDLIAGLGARDQKLYVIPSKQLVIIRMGNDSGEEALGPSGYDNQLWAKINAFIEN